MTLDELRQSLAAAEPPAGIRHALAGLWWDAKGDWERAHESAQQDEGTEGSWVHAYLHRKEGDQDNASYCSPFVQAFSLLENQAQRRRTVRPATHGYIS